MARASVGVVTRVWLSDWEWACCGDPFTVGDVVDFGIETRSPGPDLADTLGSTLFATVEAVESHHEESFADRVRGQVVAVQVVTHEVIERRSLRRSGHGAPLTATVPLQGEEWPFSNRRELGNGMYMGTQPSRYVIEVVAVSDTAEAKPVSGVRVRSSEDDEPLPSLAELTSDPPPEQRRRSLVGWLVDVQEDQHGPREAS